MSIPNPSNKIKGEGDYSLKKAVFSTLEAQFLPIAVVLVIFLVLGLFLLHDSVPKRHQVAFYKDTSLVRGGFYYGSKKRAIFYFPWCHESYLKDQADIVIFPSHHDALDAGYSPSTRCSGLVKKAS